MSAPLLSVIIPTRNRNKMVREAILSAMPELSFSHEVILSDNASEDDTASLAREFPVLRFFHRDKLLPMTAHWNVCLREAKGKYVKLLCDDDWLISGALEREVKFLEENPGFSLCASSWLEVGVDGARDLILRSHGTGIIKLGGKEIYELMLLKENIIGPPSCVTFLRENLEKFPDGYSYAADWAAWIALAEKGQVALLPEVGAKFRIHEQNLTNAFVKEDVDFFEVMALRRECLTHIRDTPFSRFKWSGLYTLIYFYRLMRRILKLLREGRVEQLPRFLQKALLYKA